MKAVDSKSGFSVLELMVAMLATSILALAVGSMLYFGWLGWRRNNESVNMQRDASLAMRTMAREIRGATDITFGASSLECETSGGTTLFTRSGGNLAVAVNGNFQMHLIRGVVTGFSPARTNITGVAIALELATGDDTATITETIYTRN